AQLDQGGARAGVPGARTQGKRDVRMPRRTNETAGIESVSFTLDRNGRKVPLRGTRWRARWRDPDGRTRKRIFARKLDAERHLAAVTHAKLTGAYVDPRAGLVTFRKYAESWRQVQVQHRPSTAAHVETHLRRHAYPVLGDRPLARIRSSEIQAWVRDPTQHLAPGTVEVVYRYVSAVFKAAVTDRVIGSSPCVGIKLPEKHKPRVQPLTVEQVDGLVTAIPDRYRALVVLGTGTGVRQGEAFGLTIDRVDFLRRSLTVDRQVVLMPGGAPAFGPPKTKASYRTIPLPDLVVEGLAAHLAAYPADGDGLVFTNDDGEPIRPTLFSA